jgi:hypothetical protein
MMARSSIDAEENHDPLFVPMTVKQDLTQQPHVENQSAKMLTHHTLEMLKRRTGLTNT